MPRLVIVSNRVSLPSDRKPKSGGLAVALQEALKGEALWFGWSGQVSDEVQNKALIETRKNLVFATLDLKPEEHRRHYQGFANSCMFPLLLYRPDLMIFRRDDLQGYLSVCGRFVEALAPLLKDDDLVWVHDNHLLAVGRTLRAAKSARRYGFFLHIPFPPYPVFTVLPCAKSIVGDLLAYDVIGFQTELDRENFLGTASFLFDIERLSDTEIRHKAQRIQVLVQPVGIDAKGFARAAERAVNGDMARRLKDSLAGRKLIIAAERLDYSKGLALRFSAFARFLDRNPQFRQKVSFLQVAARSREDVAEYQRLKREMDGIVGDINGRHAEYDWVPIRYITRSVARGVLAGLFRSAAVGLVTPLRDGLNLVCKEYVAAQDAADPGVLILSRFAGAADTMTDALIVNPHDPDGVAEAINKAMTMPLEERAERWGRLFEVVRTQSAALWCRTFVDAIAGKT